MHSAADEDRDLLRAARAGDGASFGAFFRKHQAVVLAYLARRVDQPEAAADMLAETFAALLVVVGDRRRELPECPPAWLMLTARNLLIDNHRHSKVARAASLELALPSLALDDRDIELIAEAAEDEELLQRIYELLPVEQADALKARVIEELDYGVIAGRAETSEATIRKRVSRALATLRATMENQP